jgi:hypothetical protein
MNLKTGLNFVLRSYYKMKLEIEALEARTVPAMIGSQLTNFLAQQAIQDAAPVSPDVGEDNTTNPGVGNGNGSTLQDVLVAGISSNATLLASLSAPNVVEESVDICHHTSSNKNPYVLLGISHFDSPAIETHLHHHEKAHPNHTDIVIYSFSNGEVVIQLQDLSTTVVGDIRTVTGAEAQAIVAGLDFTAQGQSGHDNCVELARRLGIDANHVSPSEDSVRNAIGQSYNNSLNRNARADEVDFWVSRLEELNLDDVAAQIENSAEGRAVFSFGQYKKLLERDADPAEVRFWVATGQTRKDILSGILNSNEFNNKYKDIDSFVDALYTKVLDRESDKVEDKFWKHDSKNHDDIVHGFLESDEFRGKH